MVAALVPAISDKCPREKFTVCVLLKLQRTQELGNTVHKTAIRGFITFHKVMWSPEGKWTMKRPTSQNTSLLELSPISGLGLFLFPFSKMQKFTFVGCAAEDGKEREVFLFS